MKISKFLGIQPMFRLWKIIFEPKTSIHWPKITLTNSKISNFEQNNHKSYLRRSNTSVSSPPSSWSSNPVHHLVIPFFWILSEFRNMIWNLWQMVKFSKKCIFYKKYTIWLKRSFLRLISSSLKKFNFNLKISNFGKWCITLNENETFPSKMKPLFSD